MTFQSAVFWVSNAESMRREEWPKDMLMKWNSRSGELIKGRFDIETGILLESVPLTAFDVFEDDWETAS